MSFATGSRTFLSFVAESSFGTTPSGPGMAELPSTGNTLELTKNALQSDAIRSDRMIEDFRHGFRSVKGDIKFELAHNNFDVWLAAALFGDWSSNVLKAGTLAKSFTVERGYTDIGRHHQFTGCMVSAFSLSVQAEAMVKGTFSILGKDMATSAASLGSPTAVALRDPFDSFSGSIMEGGGTTTTVTGIELSLDNGLEAAQVIGSSSIKDIFAGRSSLTGTVSAYFKDDALLDKFLNETESSLEFTLSDPLANTLTFRVPRLKYSAGQTPVEGERGLVVTLPFQGLYDAGEATNLKITRSA